MWGFLFVACATNGRAAEFAWEEADGETTLLYDGKPALRYMHPKLDESSPEARELTFKPFHHIFSPDGSKLLTKGPGGLYTHHRGAFFGFHKITYHGDKHCDVWHCVDGAYQAHVSEVSREADDDSASHQVAIEWHGLGGELFANEVRGFAVRRVTHSDVDGWQIDFTSHVESADGQPIQLNGDPQHAGFHFRAAQDDIAVTDEKKVNAQKQIYFVRTDGKGAMEETRNWDQNNPDAPSNAESVDRPWNAMSFLVGGERYTTLYLDHPTNPKPARYSERAYGRFGSYFVVDVTKEVPLNVRYRLWVQAGELTPEQCAELSMEFNSENAVLPSTIGAWAPRRPGETIQSSIRASAGPIDVPASPNVAAEAEAQ